MTEREGETIRVVASGQKDKVRERKRENIEESNETTRNEREREEIMKSKTGSPLLSSPPPEMNNMTEVS